MFAAHAALMTGALPVAVYYPDYSGMTISYTIGSAGPGGSGAANGTAGTTTTVTFLGQTLTANGGGGGVYNSATTGTGGTASGGDGSASGGTGAAATGNVGGGSGGAIGGGNGTRAGTTTGDAGAQSIDVSGLQAAVTSAGYIWASPGAAGRSGSATLYASTAYTQSSTYPGTTAANYTGMNDGTASGAGAQAATSSSDSDSWIVADVGATRYISKIVIGYDYLTNLPSGWGVTYTEGVPVEGSNNGTTWTTISTTPTYASTGSVNGLVTININAAYRYIRLHGGVASGGATYTVATEFQVHVNQNAAGFGCGGGSAQSTGGDGGDGLYGGGGGGAAGATSTRTGGFGGGGAVVCRFTKQGTVQYAVLTSGTSYTVPSGTLDVKIWAVGGGGGGAGATSTDATAGGGGGAGGVAYWATSDLATTNTYTQSSVYASDTAATWAGMNDNSADGTLTTQTATTAVLADEYVRTDLGSTKYVRRIVIGYDYLSALAGGWSPTYSYNMEVQGSTDGTTWTTISTTPTYASTGSSNGLVSIPINGNWRYLRLHKTTDYVLTLEFQVWTK